MGSYILDNQKKRNAESTKRLLKISYIRIPGFHFFIQIFSTVRQNIFAFPKTTREKNHGNLEAPFSLSSVVKLPSGELL